jgi:hypothetical protein
MLGLPLGMAGEAVQIPTACEWVLLASMNAAAVLRNETALMQSSAQFGSS